MKVVSTLAATVLGAFVFAGGAQAAPFSATGALPDVAASSPLTEQVACRFVKKTVIRYGRRTVSTSKICTRGGPYRRTVHKRVYKRVYHR
jgi:hypothetical protein